MFGLIAAGITIAIRPSILENFSKDFFKSPLELCRNSCFDIFFFGFLQSSLNEFLWDFPEIKNPFIIPLVIFRNIHPQNTSFRNDCWDFPRNSTCDSSRDFYLKSSWYSSVDFFKAFFWNFSKNSFTNASENS